MLVFCLTLTFLGWGTFTHIATRVPVVPLAVVEAWYVTMIPGMFVEQTRQYVMHHAFGQESRNSTAVQVFVSAPFWGCLAFALALIVQTLFRAVGLLAAGRALKA